VADAGGRVEALNRVAESLTGWAAAEARGRPLEEVFRLVDEATGAPVETPVAQVLRAGDVVALAERTALVARDGSTRPVDDSAAPIRDGGLIRGVVLVFRDVSGRRAAERVLRQSEELHRSIAELTSDYAAVGRVVGTDRVVLDFVTAGFTKVTGYTREELNARGGWPVLVHPDDRAAVGRGLERMLAGRRPPMRSGSRRRRAGSAGSATWGGRPAMATEGGSTGSSSPPRTCPSGKRPRRPSPSRCDWPSTAGRSGRH
ncbi:MAG TPA: PAS domain S-box protein, partial [Isosphaeraceae bacterium]